MHHPLLGEILACELTAATTMASEDDESGTGIDFDRFTAERAKSGRSGCKWKACAEKAIAQGDLRLGKSFKRTDGVVVTNWFHAGCFFEAMKGAMTWIVSAASDFAGFDALPADDKALLTFLVAAHPVAAAGGVGASSKGGGVAGQTSLLSFFGGGSGAAGGSKASSAATAPHAVSGASPCDDRAQFLPFCDLQESLAMTPGMGDKQALIRRYVDALHGDDLLLAFKVSAAGNAGARTRACVTTSPTECALSACRECPP